MYFKILAKKPSWHCEAKYKGELTRKDDILSNDKKRRRKLRVNFSGEVVNGLLYIWTELLSIFLADLHTGGRSLGPVSGYFVS